MNRKRHGAQAKDPRSSAPVSPTPAAGDIQALLDEAVRRHQTGRLPEAEQLCRRILAIEPGHAPALHLLGLIAHQVGNSQAAVDLIGAAIRIRPDYAEAHSNRAVCLKDLGRPGEALAACDAAIRIRPDFAAAHYNRGICLKALDRLQEAVAACDVAIRIRPDYAEAHCNRGVCLKDLGRPGEALAAYDAAIRIRPNYAEAHANRGRCLNDLGRTGEALAAYDAAIRIRPDYAGAHSNRGMCLKDLGRPGEALAAFDAAIRVRPDLAEAHSNRGMCLNYLGRLGEALAAVDRAIRIRPDLAEAHSNRGLCLTDLGRPGEALASYDAAIRIRPDYAEALSNRGNALTEMNRFDEALAAYDAAIRIRPDYAEAHSNRGMCLKDLGRIDEALAASDAAIRIKPDYAEAHSNRLVNLHYREPSAGAGVFAAAKAFGAQFDRPRAPAAFAGPPDPERRLRIGYVSADFHRHPVGYFLAPVLANHAPSEAEVFCYSAKSHDDDLTARLKGWADHWRRLNGLTDQAAAELIRSDRIDILVDLSGHTGGNRLPMFGLRPAPVQATWLGYWGTTGLASIDYILSDATTILPEEEAWYAERVLRLPSGRFCYAPPEHAPEPAPPPAPRNGFVTFGSFNNLAKLRPEVMALWASVLQAVPGSRLLLKWRTLAAESMRQSLTRAFAAAGVDPDRLDLRGESLHRAMLAQYGDMDIALDPFPFCGGLTSCEALWMGVPVVTLPGAGAQSRQTAGFLRTLGLDDLIAADGDAYVRVAAGLAADSERLAELRRTLRPRMAASPLCDGAAFTRRLEAAYRDMWRGWCAQQPPADVPAITAIPTEPSSRPSPAGT